MSTAPICSGTFNQRPLCQNCHQGRLSISKRGPTGVTRFAGTNPPPTYKLNPPVTSAGGAASDSRRQGLPVSKDGRGWVTAWRQAEAGRLLLAICSDNSVRVAVAPKTIQAAQEANAVLTAAAALSDGTLASEHTR
eukprot:SAG11_NODE_20500_length_444_cov_0.597101_1_plen_135_part_01